MSSYSARTPLSLSGGSSEHSSAGQSVTQPRRTRATSLLVHLLIVICSLLTLAMQICGVNKIVDRMYEIASEFCDYPE